MMVKKFMPQNSHDLADGSVTIFSSVTFTLSVQLVTIEMHITPTTKLMISWKESAMASL